MNVDKSAIISDTIRTVRDFIYLDVPRLYSLYSQIFEGITDHIVQETLTQAITGDTQKALLHGASTDSQALDAFRRTESIVLHDHMYNQLEHKLGSGLSSAIDMDLEQLTAQLAVNPMLKVIGRSEVEDYTRLQVFMEEFNNLGEIIAYAAMLNDPVYRASVSQLTQEITDTPAGNKKRQLETRLKQMTNASQQAKAVGFFQDPTLLTGLGQLAKMFNPNGYEVVITPLNGPQVHYRGIIDRAWLRYSPESLRSMYGSQSDTPWVMVGAATHNPRYFVEPDARMPENIGIGTTTAAPANPSMLDAYRTMFRATRDVDRMFLESATALDIVMSPLAIYREFQLAVRS